jgi:large subunit ribosomal protein L9
MQNQLLLLEDVGRLGRKGDIVKAKPGFARNFLLPQKKAIVATQHTLRLREKLQAEREKQAIVDKQEALKLAAVVEGKEILVEVKVDPAGHMYGSVSAQDIVKLFENEGVMLDKANVALVHPIRVTGRHKIDLRFKEGVTAHFLLNIVPEGFKPEVVQTPAEQ